MLSYPSSLLSHSDFPTPLTNILPVSPNLIPAYHSWSPAETLGSQVLPPVIFHRMPMAVPRVLCRCSFPLLPYRHWPSPYQQGIDEYSISYGFIPHLDSLSYIRPVLFHEAAPFALCYGLRFWPASLAEYNSPYRQAFSIPCRGKFSPCVTTRTRPLPTYPKGKLIC